MIAVNVWRGFPFFVITILAGLQAVPQDSTTPRRWTARDLGALPVGDLPSLMPVIAVDNLFSTILTFNDFSIIWILTQGGPGNATNVLSTLTYNIAIPGYELGKGRGDLCADAADSRRAHLLLNRFINRREELA